VKDEQFDKWDTLVREVRSHALDALRSLDGSSVYLRLVQEGKTSSSKIERNMAHRRFHRDRDEIPHAISRISNYERLWSIAGREVVRRLGADGLMDDLTKAQDRVCPVCGE
jgi:hypothetical protein